MYDKILENIEKQGGRVETEIIFGESDTVLEVSSVSIDGNHKLRVDFASLRKELKEEIKKIKRDIEFGDKNQKKEFLLVSLIEARERLQKDVVFQKFFLSKMCKLGCYRTAKNKNFILFAKLDKEKLEKFLGV